MGLLDFMNFNGGILGRQSPYTDEMRQRAGMQSLGLLGGTMMAAGAPTTDPGQYGRIMAQGLSQAGPQMQASLDRELAMADYQKQQEMRDQLPGILTEAGVPENMVGLLSQYPDAAIDYLMTEQPERRIVQGADGFNYYADTMERVLPGVEQPVDPFTPDLQTLTRGDQTESGYFDQNGNWVSMGSGPRWQGETPDGPDYKNFYIPGVGYRTFDLTTEAGREGAADAAARNGFVVGTSVQTDDPNRFGSETPVWPVDASGDPRAPAPGYEWEAKVENPDPANSDHWRQVPTEGGPQDPATLSSSDLSNYRKGLVNLDRAEDALEEYATLIQQNEGGLRWPGEQRARLEAAYRNVLLELKEAYNLGVLNGPDLQLMEQILTDPTSMFSQGLFYGPESFGTQIDLVRDKLRGIRSTLDETYGGAQADSPMTGDSGGENNDPLGIR